MDGIRKFDFSVNLKTRRLDQDFPRDREEVQGRLSREEPDIALKETGAKRSVSASQHLGQAQLARESVELIPLNLVQAAPGT